MLDLNILQNSDYNLLIITGIADNSSLKQKFDKISKNIKYIEFPDHYNFTKNDIDNIENEFKKIETNNKIIITTEKDAIRLREIEKFNNSIKENLFFIEIKPNFIHSKQENFDKNIIDYVEKNRRNRKIFVK